MTLSNLFNRLFLTILHSEVESSKGQSYFCNKKRKSVEIQTNKNTEKSDFPGFSESDVKSGLHFESMTKSHFFVLLVKEQRITEFFLTVPPE